MSEHGPGLKVYSSEEVDMFLAGDRRDIDRLLLHGLNNLAIVLIAHANAEEKLLTPLGTAKEIETRVAWVNAQIREQEVRTGMMRKVAESSLVMAVPAFLLFVLYAVRDSVVQWVQLAMHK